MMTVMWLQSQYGNDVEGLSLKTLNLTVKRAWLRLPQPQYYITAAKKPEPITSGKIQRA